MLWKLQKIEVIIPMTCVRETNNWTPKTLASINQEPSFFDLAVGISIIVGILYINFFFEL